MENQFTQLRFDISEKVCLHPQQPGIDALLELDLYPDVEIKDEGQHLKIQGYLRLNGVYVGEKQTASDENGTLHSGGGEEETNELAYVIPVEITLPADRAEQSRISAEVETFDYEVLSPFELNIEAILMIDGLLPERSSNEEEQSAEREPKYPVFSGSMAQPLTIAQENDQKEPAEKVKANVEPFEKKQEEEAKDAREITEMKASDEREEKTKAEKEPEEALEQASKDHSPEPNNEQEEKESKEDIEEITLSPKDFWYERQKSKAMEFKQEKEPAPVSITEEEQDDQKTELQQQEESALEPALAEEEEVSEETAIDKAQDEFESGEDESKTEWIRWLVQGKEENFVPIRMVIVQENETIDQVAGKYEVPADEIVKTNHLTTDQLEPGQILQVPGSEAEADEKRED